MKLNIDERELLQDLITSDGMKVFWKEAETALQAFYASVLQFNLDATNEKQFLILKAQADGAAKLLLALKARLDKSKKPPILNK